MSKTFAVALALFAAVQVGYVTWLTGYRAGYDDGATKAWDDAREALIPDDELTGPDVAHLELPALPRAGRQ